MYISGNYYKDSNFIYVFTKDYMITIDRNTGNWGIVVVGGCYNSGYLTQETFESWKHKCTNFGTFELKEKRGL